MAVDSLDLDTIIPEKGEVTLGGKTYIVEPPKLKNLIELSKLASKFQKAKVDESAAIAALETFKKLLYPIIPDLEKDNVDISLSQAGALLAFIMELATPTESKALKAAGVSPVEKKIPQGSDSPESSPTSSENTKATQ